jgi:hypothetical protein
MGMKRLVFNEFTTINENYISTSSTRNFYIYAANKILVLIGEDQL